jgi:DNA repair protein RecO
MLHKTRGIVLHKFSYNDKYSIVKVYTEEFGQLSYMLPGSKGKKRLVHNSVFHPLAVLTMEVEHRRPADIHKIKEAKILIPGTDILFNPVKSAISLFLAEFMSRILADLQPNKLLFNYMVDSIKILDLLERGVANFHLAFMIKISSFLGFYPNTEHYSSGMYFDMQGGIFVASPPLHPYYLNTQDSEAFLLLLRMNYENMHTFSFSRQERVKIIHHIVEYYRIHLSDFPELKSLDILQSLFD